jgi:Integrase core domain/GAG-pre-integrase domain
MRLTLGITGCGTWIREGMDSALSSIVGRTGGVERSAEDLLLLHHKRLGHPSFPVLSSLYPSLFKKANKEKLTCDACELGKHTKSSYASSCNRSSYLFNLIHSDVWEPCPTTTLNGVRYFISFIDYFSHMTWLYLMKNKSDVLACFKNFHKMVQTQYGTIVKVLRFDNETEYSNRAFGEYLSFQGIQHQTTDPYTPEQNRHLLEVIRSMMISMNVPQYLWGQAFFTAAYLINRMPSWVLDWESPMKMLKR